MNGGEVVDDYTIEASHISCKVGSRYLLHDITWRISPGQRWVVFGANGSGKTTLLSIIAGFGRYSGSLRFAGEEVAAENVLRVRRRIGWVSSSFFDKYYTREAVLDVVLSGSGGHLGLTAYPQIGQRRRAMALLAELSLADKALLS